MRARSLHREMRPAPGRAHATTAEAENPEFGRQDTPFSPTHIDVWHDGGHRTWSLGPNRECGSANRVLEYLPPWVADRATRPHKRSNDESPNVLEHRIASRRYSHTALFLYSHKGRRTGNGRRRSPWRLEPYLDLQLVPCRSSSPQFHASRDSC